MHPKLPRAWMPLKRPSQTQLDVVFESEAEAAEMLPILRQAFPSGQHWVRALDSLAEYSTLAAGILCDETGAGDVEEPALNLLDFDLFNDYGECRADS